MRLTDAFTCEIRNHHAQECEIQFCSERFNVIKVSARAANKGAYRAMLYCTYGYNHMVIIMAAYMLISM